MNHCIIINTHPPRQYQRFHCARAAHTLVSCIVVQLLRSHKPIHPPTHPHIFMCLQEDVTFLQQLQILLNGLRPPGAPTMPLSLIGNL